jgi:hypothetical protein
MELFAGSQVDSSDSTAGAVLAAVAAFRETQNCDETALSLALSTAQAQLSALTAHADLLDVDRWAISHRCTELPKFRCRQEFALVQRRRSIAALSLCSALLLDFVRVHGSAMHPECVVPTLASVETIMSHAKTFEGSLADYLLDSTNPCVTSYERTFGRWLVSEPAPLAKQSGYVPRNTKAFESRPGEAVASLEHIFEWVREHTKHHSFQISTLELDNRSRLGPQFDRPLPTVLHPALQVVDSEFQFGIASPSSLLVFVNDEAQDSGLTTLLRKSSSEKVSTSHIGALDVALRERASASRLLRLAMELPLDAVLERNKDVFLQLLIASFGAADRTLLQRCWDAICSAPPTEPTCYIVQKLASEYLAKPKQDDDTLEPLPEDDDPDSIVDSLTKTRLRVGPVAAAPNCFTRDLFGAFVVGTLNALKNLPQERQPRLAKMLSLTLRPILKRREIRLPLAAATELSAYCVQNSSFQDCQLLYQALRQSFDLEP